MTRNIKKVYAEKLLMLKEGQHSPMHFHWKKSEDIINRGGGTLIIHLYNDDGEGGLADTDVTVNSDGRSYQAPAEPEYGCTRVRALRCGRTSTMILMWNLGPVTC